MKIIKSNTLTIPLFALYVLALAWLCLFKMQFLPPATGERIINMIPFQGSYGVAVMQWGEIRNNVIAFVPMGIFICMLKSNWRFVQKIIPIAGLTVAFETIQFIFAIGRSDITDVISNVLGGMIGIGIYALLRKGLKDNANAVINIIAAIIAVSAVSLIAFLVLNGRWIMIK
jgi:glycopeptide antibiotics resistance protein